MFVYMYKFYLLIVLFTLKLKCLTKNLSQEQN